jgi:hypothetical protein
MRALPSPQRLTGLRALLVGRGNEHLDGYVPGTLDANELTREWCRRPGSHTARKPLRIRATPQHSAVGPSNAFADRLASTLVIGNLEASIPKDVSAPTAISQDAGCPQESELRIALRDICVGCSAERAVIPWLRSAHYRGPVSNQRVPGGVVHRLPPDLRTALIANATALTAWKDITPLARNEFICWVEDAKQIKTRERRIRRTQEELEEGQRRPCCWPGCRHRERNGR